MPTRRDHSHSHSSRNGNADGDGSTSCTSTKPITITPKKVLSFVAPVVIYFLSIGIYLHPLTLAPTPSDPPHDSYSHHSYNNNNNNNNNNQKQNTWSLIYNPVPQLDEMHIMTPENRDIHPNPNQSTKSTSWTEAWHNDYWGRPLTMESSHKSWRPISIWSFRFGKGGDFGKRFIAYVGRAVGGFVEGILGVFDMGFTSSSADGDGDYDDDDGRTYNNNNNNEPGLASELFVHRFVNVMIHAAIVQLIGTVATLLFSAPPKSNHRKNSNNQQHLLLLYTKYIAQILFAIHPVHVEAVANVANRPHILALLFNATIVDPGVPLIVVAVLGALGLLTAETAIFQFPAIVLTMTAIKYREISFEKKNRMEKEKEDDCDGDGNDDDTEDATHLQSPLFKTFITLLPRYILLVMISLAYLLYRHYNDTLSIPTGLIRPAENPFYNKVEKGVWSIERKAINYLYVLSLHIMKSFGVELVGFSHEYGFDCIPEMNSFTDKRLLLPASIFFASYTLLIWSWYGWNWNNVSSSEDNAKKRSKKWRGETEERIERILRVLVFFSWMATLFPISGILKVGTFVADRIAVASTFGTCIFVARFLAVWITLGGENVVTSSSSNSNGSVDAEGRGNHSHSHSHRASGGGGGGRRNNTVLIKMAFLFYLCVAELAKRTHNRAAEWMDSVTLLESSLKSCPRSIKSNLELSKIYSGLVPHMMDMERSLSLISTAQSIDPEFCDVHQQFGHVYFQQAKYIEFERETMESLLCPFTMSMAMNSWNKYWKFVLQNGGDKEAQKRYDRYMARIQREVARQEMEEKMKKSSGSRIGGADNEEL